MLFFNFSFVFAISSLYLFISLSEFIIFSFKTLSSEYFLFITPFMVLVYSIVLFILLSIPSASSLVLAKVSSRVSFCFLNH
ncbi:putative membrane protein [[Clostridium] sordellii ATCC 9714]|nr:putative membrane protein [[Clostridium] sordellii ATCC 9714] [Paeniclostridium sordellii ATCC 9714]